VQTVTARYQIESSWAAVFELNIDADSIFTNGSDAVAEDGLDVSATILKMASARSPSEERSKKD